MSLTSPDASGPLDPQGRKSILKAMFDVAVEAALPRTCVPPFLPELPENSRLVVVGAGKASAAMAKAVEDNWHGPLQGLVVTRYGYGVACEQIEIIEAAHPVPDEAGLAAARRIMAIAQGLEQNDVLLCLISGGGSALLTMPAEGMSLADKQSVNNALLKSGATISEMNCVRKHLSGIKGGRLAVAACPVRVVSLLISDVPGDDPSVIASGPTVPDDTTCEQARAILECYEITPPASVLRVLCGASSETPETGDPRLANTLTELVALPKASLEAACTVARQYGYTPLMLGDDLEGEARQVAREHAALALDIKAGKGPVAAPCPCAVISGGETTVVVRGGGRGGRNSEYMLAMAQALDGAEGIHAIACDTDGIDGTEDNAGAMIAPDTLSRAASAGMKPQDSLDSNDSWGFFQALDDLVITGPTYTNVNDFRVILID